MDQFQCFECGMISVDLNKVTRHLNAVHNIKTEDDQLRRKLSGSLCEYTTRAMDELTNHLIMEHKKEKHDWMVEEIKAEFNCDECDLKFPRKSLLESHLETAHSGDRGIHSDTNYINDKMLIIYNKQACCAGCRGRPFPMKLHQWAKSIHSEKLP